MLLLNVGKVVPFPFQRETRNYLILLKIGLWNETCKHLRAESRVMPARIDLGGERFDRYTHTRTFFERVRDCRYRKR